MAELDKGSGGDELDRVLDLALAKYAAVEPRTGLEERVLANLRSVKAIGAHGAWWRWSLAAAAAALLVAITLAWKSHTPSPPAIANHPTSTAHRSAGPEKDVAHHDANAIPRPRRVRRIHALGSAPVVAAVPKLDQFPSPHPLSEQEQILAAYVAQFHDEAVLIARARKEAMEKDREQEMREAGSDGSDSQVR